MKYANRVVLMYDFDGTLAPGNMQEYSYMSDIVKMDKDVFWSKISKFGTKYNMDPILASMYGMLVVAEQKGTKLKRQDFVDMGKSIKLFPGVEEWFDRINEYGKSKGLEIEHYIISSGQKEIIEGTSIAKHFKKIFASCFCYKNDIPFWPAQSVNYTMKTQYIYRIRKNAIEDLYDSHSVNSKVTGDKIPYENMIYFGDGDTDVPSMMTLKLYGGKSICVYNPQEKGKRENCRKLYLDRRTDEYAKADYSEGGKIDRLVKYMLDKIASYLN